MLLTDQKSTEFAAHLRDAVERALATRKISARRASLDVVGHDGLIRDIRAGRIPSADRVAALFAYLGLETYFGPPRPQVQRPANALVGNADPDDTAPAGFLTIPWTPTGARPGSAPVAFSRMWLAEHGLVADFLMAAVPDIISVSGSHPADTVALIDSRMGKRCGHSLWGFSEANRIHVAHITFLDKLALLHPANPEDAPRVIDEPVSKVLTLLGKVVWLGQSVPFKGKIG